MTTKEYKYTSIPSHEELRKIFETDPNELELIRTELSEQLINSCSEISQRKLNGLMFKINLILRKSKNPHQSCILLHQIMMDNLFSLNEILVNPSKLNERIKNTSNSAKVIQFNKIK